MHCHQESNRVRFTYSTEIVLVTELQRQTDCKIFELHRFLKLKSVEHGLFLLLVLVKGIFIKSIRNPVTGKGAQHRVRKHEPIKTLVNLLLRHEILRCANKKRVRANKNRAYRSPKMPCRCATHIFFYKTRRVKTYVDNNDGDGNTITQWTATATTTATTAVVKAQLAVVAEKKEEANDDDGWCSWRW